MLSIVISDGHQEGTDSEKSEFSFILKLISLIQDKKVYFIVFPTQKKSEKEIKESVKTCCITFVKLLRSRRRV